MPSNAHFDMSLTPNIAHYQKTNHATIPTAARLPLGTTLLRHNDLTTLTILGQL